MKTTFLKVLFAPMFIAAMILAPDQAQSQSKKELQAEVEKWKKQVEANQEQQLACEKTAMEYKKLAESNAELARRAERTANRARYLAQAKAMAVKSRELSAYPDLEALVAMQAYRFNEEYEGNPY